MPVNLLRSLLLAFCCLILSPFSRMSYAQDVTPENTVAAQDKNQTPHKILSIPTTDAELLDKLQRDAFNYMWEYSFPESGMAYEDSRNKENGPAAVGGTGFGIASIIVAVERKWVSRVDAVNRILKICTFLHDNTEKNNLHGAFPHWVNGRTGKTIPFGENDNGADIVETSLLMQGLLLAREYFSSDNSREKELVALITELWREVDWHWFTQGENNGLYWHWSPSSGFKKGMKISGFNEALITYVLALASPTYPISRETAKFWYSTDEYQPKEGNGYIIEAANKYAGCMFLSHYSFIGLNPAKLFDSYVKKGYMVRNTVHTLMNRAYCLESAPQEHKFSEGYWGLTSCDIKGGYRYQSAYNEVGTVAPTAAISSMPYTPEYSMRVLWNLIENFPDFWGAYGPYDAFSLKENWFDTSYLAIDQLPMVAMIENYRSGLLWKLFMNIPEIKIGLGRMGFSSKINKTGFAYSVPALRKDGEKYVVDALDIRKHPDKGDLQLPFSSESAQSIKFELSVDDTTLEVINVDAVAGYNVLSLSPDRLPYNRIMKLTMANILNEPSLPIRINKEK